ncbi:phage tail protein, partial [Acinetobacter baumannii]
FNQYNTETVEPKDQANIEMFGLRTQDPVKYDFFCEPKIARHAVQLLLQRKLYVRNEYEFDLGWKYCRLEPMDIVTLTDESLGLDRFP